MPLRDFMLVGYDDRPADGCDGRARHSVRAVVARQKVGAHGVARPTNFGQDQR